MANRLVDVTFEARIGGVHGNLSNVEEESELERLILDRFEGTAAGVFGVLIEEAPTGGADALVRVVLNLEVDEDRLLDLNGEGGVVGAVRSLTERVLRDSPMRLPFETFQVADVTDRVPQYLYDAQTNTYRVNPAHGG